MNEGPAGPHICLIHTPWGVMAKDSGLLTPTSQERALEEESPTGLGFNSFEISKRIRQG